MILRILDRLEEILIASLLAAATLLVFVAVVHRYGTGIPVSLPTTLIGFHISWAQELCIYMFVWVAKFGAAYGVRTGIHVGVDVVVNMLEPGPRKKVVLFSLFCGALFTGVVGTMGASFVIGLYPDRPDLARLGNPELDRLSCASRSAPISCASASCRSPGLSGGPANCLIMIPARSRASIRTPSRRNLA